MDDQPIPTMRDLYPNLAETDLAIAEQNLEQYLLLVWRIYERISADPEAYARFRALKERVNEVCLSVSPSLPAADQSNQK